MIKLRKPFSQKVKLHIRQDMLQRLWDKYVPTSSPGYEKIELVYLKGGPEEMDKQPERIQLLLHLILKNKMLQLNLMQQPAVIKPGQRQMENSLRRMERYYAVQLKSDSPAMYRNLRQYFALLEQVGEDNRRYQNWQKTNLAIEKQKDAYRLLSLFSEKLWERLTVHSVSTLRRLERDFVDSLTETEYQMLAEELIWQEKPKLLMYFDEWDEAQCGNIITELEQNMEQNTDMRQILSQTPGQSIKEKLITAAEKLGQREFCLFYHQITDLEAVNPQVIVWKESRTKMLDAIDQMEPEALQQLQEQIEDLTYPLEQDTPRVQDKDSHDQNTLQIQDEGNQDQEMLRTLERELVYSLSETEYQTLSEKSIWQEKPELIAYLKRCEQVQCMEIVKELEKDEHLRQVLSLDARQPVKERLVTAAEKLEQKDFSLFYHQVMKLDGITLQIAPWKESRTEMVHVIDQMGSRLLEQVWKQIEHAENQSEDDALRAHENQVQNEETLRIQEKELLYALLETEYQTLAERLIWQEKPELIAYFKECEKAFCKEIIRQLEKDPDMRQVLSTIQKQSAKKKLIAAAYKLEQREFCLFYWQVADLLRVNPQIVIWKKSRAEMLESIDELNLGGLQKAWEQMQAVEPVQGLKQVYTEKLLHLQNQYQQNESGNFQEQLADLLEENDLAGIADIITLEQLMQDDGPVETAETPADDRLETAFGEHARLVLWDGAYQVIRNLEHERRVRRESIEQQQIQAASLYQEVYHQILETKESAMQRHENTMQAVEQIFRRQHQEQLTEQEIRNIYEWSQAFLESYFAQQGQTATDADLPEERASSSEQKERSELIHVIRQMDQYMMEHDMEVQHGAGEERILRWQEKLLEDERIQRFLTYIRELEEQQKERLIHYLADMVQLSVQSVFQRKVNTKVNTSVQPDRTEISVPSMQSDRQKAAEELPQLRQMPIQDREFAERLLQVEDRAFAERLLWLEDRELTERLLQLWTEDKEFAERLLQMEDREFVRLLLRTEDKEFAERLLQLEDREFARLLLRTEDKEFAERLLQLEDREFARLLLRTEDKEFAERLLQLEDRAFARLLLQLEDRESARLLLQAGAGEGAGSLLQDSGGQLLDISYKSLWEWGETLLFHPEQERESEDADMLSFPQQEAFSPDSDDTRQADVQTQLIRRQIEMAKDRNRLQSLIRQINHQADIQMIYTDTQLKLPQIQALLQYVRQLDESQYGVFVKKLAQIIKLQKLSFEETEVVSSNAQEAKEDELSDSRETNTVLIYDNTKSAKQFMQDDTDTYESITKPIRIEDKEFIEKLLREEDREFARRLLQVNDTELARRLLQTEDRELVRRLLQVNDTELAKRLLQEEDREFVRRLLQVNDTELARRLLQTEDRELARKLLQINDTELARKLLRIEDREFVWKLLGDNDGQTQDVSYRNMWEWGEALLLHLEYHPEEKDADDVSSPQQEVPLTDEQTQIIHQRNHLKSLIGQINHQADVQLTYTDAQLKMPQVQELLQYIRQLDVKQYGMFVRELAQVMMVQKLSYDEPETGSSAHPEAEGTLSPVRTFPLEQRTAAYQTIEQTTVSETMLPYLETFATEQVLEPGTAAYQRLVQFIQSYERQRQAELYRKITQIGQELFPRAWNHVHGPAVQRRPYGQLFHETGRSAGDMGNDAAGVNADNPVLYETVINADNPASYETVTNVSRQTSYEMGNNTDNLASYETSINAYSIMPHEETVLADSLAFTNAYSIMPHEETMLADNLAFYEPGRNEFKFIPHEEAGNEYAQAAFQESSRQESRYQPHELAYSVQNVSISEEDQQRQELRMQQETAQLKSVQEQLDRKLKEVEQQLKKVEDSTKAKEDVKTFAEQVKRQLYEELHVEKLRRGLI